MGKGLGIPPLPGSCSQAAPHLLPPGDGLGGFNRWLLPLPPWLCPPARTRYGLGWGAQQGSPQPFSKGSVWIVSAPLQPGFALNRGLQWSRERSRPARLKKGSRLGAAGRSQAPAGCCTITQLCWPSTPRRCPPTPRSGSGPGSLPFWLLLLGCSFCALGAQ